MIEIIKSIEESILKINDEITKLQDDKQNLIHSKDVLFKINNICPECYGKGFFYGKSDYSNPYEKSSDLHENCLRCKGSGKYVNKQKG